jgi:hypothetical protein
MSCLHKRLIVPTILIAVKQQESVPHGGLQPRALLCFHLLAWEKKQFVTGCRASNGGKELPKDFVKRWLLPSSSTAQIPSELSMEAGVSNWLLLPVPTDFSGAPLCSSPPRLPTLFFFFLLSTGLLLWL